METRPASLKYFGAPIKTTSRLSIQRAAELHRVGTRQALVDFLAYELPVALSPTLVVSYIFNERNLDLNYFSTWLLRRSKEKGRDYKNNSIRGWYKKSELMRIASCQKTRMLFYGHIVNFLNVSVLEFKVK